MPETNIAERERASNALIALAQCSNILFDRAPVMMHMVDGSGRLSKVNRRWSQTLGYKRREVLGLKSTDFLTPESRERAVKDTMPLFRRVGSARSIGFRFVKRDGRTLDAHLDAEAVTLPGGSRGSYAGIRAVDDRQQREQALATIEDLKGLASVQNRFGLVLAAQREDESGTDIPIAWKPGDPTLEKGLAREALVTLIEMAGDISASLGALPRVHEEWLSAMHEQQGELLLVAKSIDRSLLDIADTMAEIASKPR